MSPPFDPAPPTTVAGVLERFDAILGWAREQQSRLGCFAALYRGVTLRAQAAAGAGAFEDRAATERLLILFAGRYFAALSAWHEARPVTASWQVAFDAGERWPPTVLQHLLLGINAHINLDLGIATARASAVAAVPRADFDRVNDLLARLVDEVEAKLAEIWPLLRLLDALGGRADEALIGFGLRQARAEAWALAQALAAAGADDGALIAERDQRVARIARRILRPGPLLRLTLGSVRLGERRATGEVIDLLAAEAAAPPAGLGASSAP